MTEISVFINRVKVGVVPAEGKLGDIISVILHRYQKQLNVVSSPTSIIDNPPDHSDASFLFLGPSIRFLSCFNLSQLSSVKFIPFASAITRKAFLHGDHKETSIRDIPYSSAEAVYIFTYLNDWISMVPFEELHHKSLVSHHNWLRTKDVKYRHENQQYRRTLRDELHKFLHRETCKGLCRPIADRSYSTSHPPGTSAVGNCVPLATSITPVEHPTSHSTQRSLPESGYSPDLSPAEVDPANAYHPPCHSRVRLNASDAVLQTLTNSSYYAPMAGEEVEGEAIYSIEYRRRLQSNSEAGTRQTHDTIEDDYQVALSLHEYLNKGHAAIERLADAGIARHALTGQRH
jgi:hypothetical protein